MKIGMFRRQVAKTFAVKATKIGLRNASKSTSRVLAAQSAVALKAHTGQLVQATSQYLLGLQMTQEMKDAAFVAMGDIGFDLTALCRVLKVKLPSSTKKSKLVGTRAAAILQLDSLTTNLLVEAQESMFSGFKATKVTKMVSMPQKGGVKEEREVEVVDVDAETLANEARQTEMRSYLTGAVDVYWRLSFDLLGEAPASALAAKFDRMKVEFPGTTWAEDVKPKAGKAKPKPPVKAKKATAPATASV
jgi:hypothetical protein